MKKFEVGKSYSSRYLKEGLGSWYVDSYFLNYFKALPREPKKLQYYECLQLLPSPDEIVKALNEKYTQTVSSVVDDCTSDVEDLASEMSDWHDSIPENLQYSDKAVEVEEAQNALEAIFIDEAPEEVKDLTLVVYPEWNNDSTSRASRRDYVVLRLNQVVERLSLFEEENPDSDESSVSKDWRESLENEISELENVEFPSMF